MRLKRWICDVYLPTHRRGEIATVETHSVGGQRIARASEFRSARLGRHHGSRCSGHAVRRRACSFFGGVQVGFFLSFADVLLVANPFVSKPIGNRETVMPHLRASSSLASSLG